MLDIRYTQECREAAEGRYPVGANGKRPTSITVQENWLLENVFGRAHPATPILWFAAPVTYGVWRGLEAGPVRAGLLFAAGCLLWSLIEYVLHRALFHFRPTSERQRLQAFLLHGYHHAFPNDKTRLVAPPWMSWPSAAVVFASYHLALPAVVAWPLFAGTVTGYVAYDCLHYYAHHFKPSNALGKWLRAYHLQHHHADDPSRYGVTSPLWDFVFGTFRPVVRSSPRDSR